MLVLIVFSINTLLAFVRYNTTTLIYVFKFCTKMYTDFLLRYWKDPFLQNVGLTTEFFLYRI